MAHVDDNELVRLAEKLAQAYADLNNDKNIVANYRREADKFTRLADQEQKKIDDAMSRLRTESEALRDAMTEPTTSVNPEFPGTGDS